MRQVLFVASLCLAFSAVSVQADEVYLKNGDRLTGKIVSPTLYIGFALSGSSQHMAGCSGSKNIIAINKDGEANIFKESRFGVVGDYKKVLPAFTQKVKELLSG